MIYPGDVFTFVYSVTRADGTIPNVTVPPSIQIINAHTGLGMLTSAQNMTLASGTRQVYTYPWTIPSTAVNGDYFAIASCASDGITVQNSSDVIGVMVSFKFMQGQLRLGDTYITGPVALNGTVALNATVAKDATVAKASDLVGISPDNSTTVLAIKAKTDNLPSDPASVTIQSQIIALLNDVHDCNLGPLVIDRTTTPRTMTIKRLADNSVLAVFNLTDDGTQSSRIPQ